MTMNEIGKAVFEQLNRLLAEKARQANIIGHNLEKGLGNEHVLREVLRNFFPAKFGVGKGKIVNGAGESSRHCDVIIYDAMSCPKLFVDENKNQILPVEGVLAVIEVKTTLTKVTLGDAFENLYSVYGLQPERPVRSLNELVDHRPPMLLVLGYGGLKLDTLDRHYRDLCSKYPVLNSAARYSEKSPGSKWNLDSYRLVSEVACLGEGSVYEMLNGSYRKDAWGDYTLGMFLTSLLSELEEMPAMNVVIGNYFNYLMLEADGLIPPRRRGPRSGEAEGDVT
ncbi:DUF6602 domain-containing protein [Micromonospora sp. NPDC000207]|uniref:DUF6602 domain-containing protein n=1 Tax=Micromonospora sp. NPDC000207 TaxID=3154246 RepID=UPI00332AF774